MNFLPDSSMASPYRARENSMASRSARIHQLVSEPFLPSPRSSADRRHQMKVLDPDQWQHPSDPKISHHPQLTASDLELYRQQQRSDLQIDHHHQVKVLDPHQWQYHHHLQGDQWQQHSGYRIHQESHQYYRQQPQDSQYFIQDSRSKNSDFKKADLINSLPKNFRFEDLIERSPLLPQDPNEGKTRSHDESIRDNMIQSNEGLEQHSREPHTDFRSEVSVEKEQGVSLWSMIKDNIRKDLTKVCLPAYINEPLSSLQKCFEDLEYSYSIDQAYEWGKKSNDLLRMLNVGAFATSGSASTEEKVSDQPMELLSRPRPPPQPPPKPPPQPLHNSPPKPTEIHFWQFFKQVKNPLGRYSKQVVSITQRSTKSPKWQRKQRVLHPQQEASQFQKKNPSLKSLKTSPSQQRLQIRTKGAYGHLAVVEGDEEGEVESVGVVAVQLCDDLGSRSISTRMKLMEANHSLAKHRPFLPIFCSSHERERA